ncbi:uncharacterized protein LOC130592092 [Beta vulgaris subsp. vulgaris]|uniref:uncharacterized protein LOC130592092 n=1 Tax=Beta vulgaris subsp. vulgaris TaxID=3555 RepID=UPI002548724C|nr:uncharacterized protein LOC130592092 [Beta vulgaris subsp. vulgaris]
MTTQEMTSGPGGSRLPKFNGTNYPWWKNCMRNLIIGTDYECWMIIRNGPRKVAKNSDGTEKKETEYTTTDLKTFEKNAKAMSLLQQGIADNEVSRILACYTAKEIWETLELAYEGTSEVRRSKVDMLMSKYETFNMNRDENIRDMFTRFMTIINELKSLGKDFTNEDLVRKILRSLTGKWLPKVTAIQEAKDLTKLSMEQLIGSLMTHEMLVE